MRKKLKANNISIPQFSFTYPKSSKSKQKLTLFDLSSHDRAREALSFGLDIKEHEFNIFVVGEDRTGRLTATLYYIENYQKTLLPGDDWVYLYNFDNPQEPLPFRFPNGKAKEFSRSLQRFIRSFALNLLKTFNSEDFTRKLKKPSKKIEEEIHTQLEDLRKYALKHNIDIIRNADGSIAPIHILGNEKTGKKNISKGKSTSVKVWNEVSEKLQAISMYAEYESEQISEEIEKIKKKEAEKILKPFVQKYLDKFRDVPSLPAWVEDFQEDILHNLKWFVQEREEEENSEDEAVSARYSVNVLVKAPKNHPPLVVEPNPTYENLFGKITYKYAVNGYSTNFTMISPGSLHRANGGVLIIRADALAQNPESWKYLKDALRDRVIRIEELHRTNAIPMLEAPKPKPIPLALKVVIIGSPLWFYSYFYADQDFKTYFKIKAEISPYFEATAKNLSTIAKMIQNQTLSHLGFNCSKTAMSYILGYSARMAEHRRKLSARIEALMDIIYEAGTIACAEKNSSISLENVKTAIIMRNKRDALIQEQTLEMMHEGVLKISTSGFKIGQLNGLTVQEIGGYTFGSPSRITAQSSIGNRGVVNIEHMVEMSGSIQHKGVLILEGFLRGTFAKDFPLSCNCSITFEQTYVGVDGDSASAAELCAILSSLSNIPLKQNIALTGAINQFGDIQAVGGINEKIEGFYNVCKYRGLTGLNGVILPHSNELNVIVSPEVSEAIERGQFHLWSIQHVTEALDLLAESGHKKVFKEVEKTLAKYDASLSKRIK